MAVFAIADLHLSHVDEKSMDIFGRHWKGHWDKIQQAWRSRIGADQPDVAAALRAQVAHVQRVALAAEEAHERLTAAVRFPLLFVGEGDDLRFDARAIARADTLYLSVEKGRIR